MNKLFITILLIIGIIHTANSQIPYFAPTVGSNNLYGYTSLKVRPGVNSQETYTTFQYGIGNLTATGLDLYTAGHSTYCGFLARFGYTFNKWFKVGVQITPSFDISNNLRFSYLTNALYMNGNISRSGKYFWTANTWYTLNYHLPNTINQFLYLGATYSLSKGQSITPMLGTIYSWEFNSKADLTFGAYWSVQQFNIYLWSNDILKRHPRVVIGIDFTLSIGPKH